MKLEWFRHHKKFVYILLLPVVVGTMAFFGASSALDQARSSSEKGPGVLYKVGAEEFSMSPAEVLALRLLLTNFSNNRQSAGASTDEAAFHQASYANATALGFEVGTEEEQEALRRMVKDQIITRDGKEPSRKIDEELYHALVRSMDITPAQFERMTHEFEVRKKMLMMLGAHIKINDAELYVAYVRDKEVARIRFKELRSDSPEFMTKVTEPDAKRIDDFYEANKTKPAQFKEVMFTLPSMSADLLHLDTKKLFGGDEIKPSEEDIKKHYEKIKAENYKKVETKVGEAAPAIAEYKPLADVKADVEKRWYGDQVKAYYDRFKTIYWKVQPKDGEAPPEPGKETFKPFEDVKAEVETKWKDDEKRNRPQARMNALKAELQEAEKKYDDEQAKLDKDKRKPFDLPAWAKSKDLTHWETKAQPEEVYKKGKQEVGAPDASWVASLFSLMQEFPNTQDYRFMNELNKKRQMEFSYPVPMSSGVVMSRIKEYIKEAPLKLDEAKPKIAEYLKVQDAALLARKAAEALRDDWSEGKNLPDLKTLDEVSVKLEDRHALAGAFFDKPKAVGEVVLAEGPLEENPAPNASKLPHSKLYVGVVVERELPTWEAFNADTTWKRDQEKNTLERSFSQFLSQSIDRLFTRKRFGSESEPPLFENYSRSPSN